jgi:hypothetical protein
MLTSWHPLSAKVGKVTGEREKQSESFHLFSEQNGSIVFPLQTVKRHSHTSALLNN